jgi:hypothetical protein
MEPKFFPLPEIGQECTVVTVGGEHGTVVDGYFRGIEDGWLILEVKASNLRDGQTRTIVGYNLARVESVGRKESAV